MAKQVNCKNCGTINLTWKQTAKGWRLFDTEGNQHRCADGAPAAPRTTATPQSISKGTPSILPTTHSFNQLVEKVADLILRVDELEKQIEALKPKKPEDQLDLFDGK